MGMGQSVVCAGAVPPWNAVRDLLRAQQSLDVQMRMIDGQLAFPDEEPGADWRELRVGTAAGMVTVRSGAEQQVHLVVWGNADAELVRLWNSLTWAFAELCQGSVQTPGGPVDA